MVISCQECGKEVEESFQFCPFCGKKLVKPKICSNCGFKLKENFMFCPECGKKWDTSKKGIIPIAKKAKEPETTQKVEETKPAEKPKPVETVKSKATKPKISLNFLGKIKRPGKKVLMIISVICIVLVVAAAVILFNPFDTNGTPSGGGGTFTITVENNYSDSVSVKYYLTIDDYYNIGSLNTPYTLLTDDSMTFNINENDLTIPKNQHKVTLFASEDGLSWESSTASSVTESATFEIFDDNGIIGVNCTGLQ